MNVIRTRLHVAADGTISGHAPVFIPPGEHEAEITVAVAASAPKITNLRAAVRGIQEKVGRLPILDGRSDDEILGYDERGLPR